MRRFLHLSNTEISCWLEALTALSLCFSPLIFHFTWGNHDWLPLLVDSSLSAGLIEGRFSQYIFLNLFLSGKILPILNILCGFAIYTLSLIILCTRFFEFPITRPTEKLCLIAISTLPFVIEILYFHFITFSMLTWPFIIVLSLLSAKTANNQHLTRQIFLSTLLLFIAIGGYPASASMYAVGTLLYLIQKIPTATSLKKLITNLTPFAISFVLAFLPIPFIYKYLKQNNLMISLYNSETETISGILQKIPDTILLNLQSLIQPQPFFSLSFKLLTAFIFLLFIIKFFKTCHQQKRLSLGFTAFIVLNLSLKLPTLLSHETAQNYFSQFDPTVFMVRIDFYSIPTLLLFSLFYTINQNHLKLNNLIFILSTTLLFLNLNTGFSFAKTQILGFTAENLLLERLTSRIQSTPNYNQHQFYHLTQAGEISLRSKYYTKSPLEKYGYYTLQVPFTRYWLASEHYNFYAPQEFASNQTAIDLRSISPKASEFLSYKIESWPSKQSIHLDSDYGIIALTPEGTTMLKNMFNSQQRLAQ